jgi:hypothetical protein
MLRNGQELWTVGNVHALHEQRPESIVKSRSRFKNKRINVLF